jgi:hypothetical protein
LSSDLTTLSANSGIGERRQVDADVDFFDHRQIGSVRALVVRNRAIKAGGKDTVASRNPRGLCRNRDGFGAEETLDQIKEKRRRLTYRSGATSGRFFISLNNIIILMIFSKVIS